MKTIITMDTNECAAYLRAHGMKISKETLAFGLEQGVYPFGVCVSGGRERVFQIFKALLDKWIEEREVEA